VVNLVLIGMFVELEFLLSFFIETRQFGLCAVLVGWRWESRQGVQDGSGAGEDSRLLKVSVIMVIVKLCACENSSGEDDWEILW